MSVGVAGCGTIVGVAAVSAGDGEIVTGAAAHELNTRPETTAMTVAMVRTARSDSDDLRNGLNAA